MAYAVYRNNEQVTKAAKTKREAEIERLQIIGLNLPQRTRELLGEEQTEKELERIGALYRIDKTDAEPEVEPDFVTQQPSEIEKDKDDTTV